MIKKLNEEKRDKNILYLSNSGRNVQIDYGNSKIQYLGPKNIVKFLELKEVKRGVAYVDTIFRDDEGKEYAEEEYIDLVDVFSEYGINLEPDRLPEVVIINH